MFRDLDIFQTKTAKFVAVYEDPNHNVVHFLKFGEANGFSSKPFDTYP
ncbi:hypothetical protein CCP3SC1_490008 [Gammaproteobacteria bacterium]